MSIAVSGNQRPSASRPKRSRKSRIPQRISVRRSAAEASAAIAWWYDCAIPLPRETGIDASRSAGRSPSMNPRYAFGSPVSSHSARVGPRSHDIWP